MARREGPSYCEHCEGEWGPPGDTLPDIINGVWDLGDSGLQCNGRKAPRLDKLRVFGAFLDDRLNEFIPWSEALSRRGYSPLRLVLSPPGS